MSYTSTVVTAGGQREIPFPLHPIFQVVNSTDMPSGVSFFHSAIPAGAPGAPPHVHAHEDELYYILEGTAHFLLGDRVGTAGVGDTVILPRGEFHANWNEGDTPVTSLVFVSQNSRFEGFFDDVAQRVIAQGIEDPKEAAMLVGATGAEYGVTIDMSKTPDRAKPFFGMG
ncbi:cupin domain-containing protein [Rhodosalinus sediminis]|uniref:cupin domain-containing protein n=1 Tax=Rhodosalinus sediminis TaxID=1940533 RepID=UPI002355500F|nr:cupin domain-containing protein [Rhodosalinus sediminis]